MYQNDSNYVNINNLLDLNGKLVNKNYINSKKCFINAVNPKTRTIYLLRSSQKKVAIFICNLKCVE